MRKLFIATALVLSACATVPDAESVATAVERAVRAEKAVALACMVRPRSEAEVQLQVAARFAFISSYGSSMTVEQRAVYEGAMRETDEACN